MHDDIATSKGELTADELELVAYLLEDEGVELTSQRIIPRRDPDAEIPPSLGQERLWFLDQWDPGNPASNIPFAMRLSGTLVVEAFERSINTIVERHEALRTTFVAKDGQPQQVVAPVLVVPLNQVDLRHIPAAEHDAALRRLIMENAQHRFDLARGPLVRADLVRLADREHVFLLNIHHIVFDAWSVGLFLRELTVLYDAFVRGLPSPLPALPVQYPDYAIWQRQWLQGEAMQQELGYWKRQLGGNLPVLELPADRPRPAVLTYEGAIATSMLPAALAQGLSELSHREGCTLFMTLFAGFQILLHRYTGQSDILTSTMTANRSVVDIEELMGLFLNTLVLRTDLGGDPPFRRFLAAVRETTLEGFAHQNVLFEQLIEELKPPRDPSHTPVFQTMFILQNSPVPARVQNDLQVEFLRVDNGTSKYDLTLSLTELPEGIRIAAEYRAALFDPDTIMRMLGHYQTLLEAAVANPDLRLSELPLLPADERRRVLHEWNPAPRPLPATQCLHELIAEQVARTPEATALVVGEQHLSYRELDRRANRLAHHLRAQGIGPEQFVGIYTGRTAELVVAVLGVLKAGAAYVPLDPAYPPERLAIMLADSRAPVVLTTAETRGTLPFGGTLIDLDSAADAIAAQPDTPPDSGVMPENLAYVLFTSGSTGRPKGVQIAHRSAVNFLCSMLREPGLSADDTVLALTTLAFDISVLELFLPLLAGARIALIDRATAADSTRLAEAIERSGVTVMQATPATWRMLLDAGWAGRAGLTVLSGGEGMPRELAERLRARCGRVWNVYGPTETTVWGTIAEATGSPAALTPIGVPVDNALVYILDPHMRPVPINVPGELYIGGVGLARGYIGRPDLTAERFVPNPLGTGDWGLGAGEENQEPGSDNSKLKTQNSRLYRTGDLCRWLPDGQLEFLGRIDHQVKLRGFRIELGEIEAVLAEHPAVRAAVVVMRADATGDPFLAAYVVPQADEAPAALVPALRAHLGVTLPDYMVPAAFMLLHMLPLTPSGKVDRKALPAPDHSTAARPMVAPRTPVEKALAKLWADVLGRETVGVEDSFFEIGGHSLKATQLISRLREIFHTPLSLRDVFQATTVAALAQVVVAHETQPGQADKIALTWLRLQSITPEERQRMLEHMRKNRDLR
ncbi:MAG TPA: amino acid adenylation domain-containing protein [Roseiflexaceae bacterium]|nr:amino acid adenylation domain-containing protein [Roseiflexaceae bacterium]